MKKTCKLLGLFFLMFGLWACGSGSLQDTYLAALDPVGTPTVGWGEFSARIFAVENSPEGLLEGETIHSHGLLFENGLAAHAPSEVSYELAGNFTRLNTTLVVYNEGNSDCGDGVIFKVLVDGTLAYESAVMLPTSDPTDVEIPLPAGRVLTLIADPQVDNYCDFAIWGDPILLP
jgi:hypothetical protein